jgi:predicted O-methyltransferase YrrM
MIIIYIIIQIASVLNEFSLVHELIMLPTSIDLIAPVGTISMAAARRRPQRGKSQLKNRRKPLLRQIRDRLARLEGRRHWAALCQQDARFRVIASMLPAVRVELAVLHRLYTQLVSPADMALSLETAALLIATLRMRVPSDGAVADLGSGFSSAVLRLALLGEPTLTLRSVDDDPHWLDRSAAFIGRLGLPTAGLSDWPAFEAEPAAYDLILNDLGHLMSRRTAMKLAWTRLKPGGVIIVDDMQVVSFRRWIRAWVQRRGGAAFSAHRWTADRYCRHAWVVLKPDALSRPASTRTRESVLSL